MKKNLTREDGGYSQSFKHFIKNNCRLATLEEENEMYDDEFSNALVLDAFEDVSYSISFIMFL